MYRQGGQVITFDLAGADVAIPQVLDACSSGASKSTKAPKPTPNMANGGVCFELAVAKLRSMLPDDPGTKTISLRFPFIPPGEKQS